MTDLAGAFAELARSTAEFHARFETDKHITLLAQWQRVVEEYYEAEQEVGWVLQGKLRQKELARELTDMLVTMLGVLPFAGISEADLIEALLDTARKNDDKTLLNCTWHNNKVTRNEKLPRDGA